MFHFLQGEMISTLQIQWILPIRPIELQMFTLHRWKMLQRFALRNRDGAAGSGSLLPFRNTNDSGTSRTLARLMDCPRSSLRCMPELNFT